MVQSDQGNEVVGWIGEGGTLTFPDVRVPTNGTYTVLLGYANCTGDRQAVILVNNGETGQLVTMPSHGGTASCQIDRWPVQLSLHAGPNTISIGNPDAYAPDIRSITVSGTPAQSG